MCLSSAEKVSQTSAKGPSVNCRDVKEVRHQISTKYDIFPSDRNFGWPNKGLVGTTNRITKHPVNLKNQIGFSHKWTKFVGIC